MMEGLKCGSGRFPLEDNLEWDVAYYTRGFKQSMLRSDSFSNLSNEIISDGVWNQKIA